MNVKDFIKDNILILDGAMGTELQKAGILPGESPEEWNITHPETIVSVHKAYLDAGSNVISTNTFGVNSLKYSSSQLEALITAAVENAKKAIEMTDSVKEKYIAFDIGPLGKLLKPYGDIGFNEAVEIFAINVRIACRLGVDLFFIETMNDSYETKAALLAVKENSELPVFVSNAYGEDGKLMTGASPAAMASMLEGMGADAIGANCSFGPRQTIGIVKELLENTSLPVLIKPNAGLPHFSQGKTVYNVSSSEFSDDIIEAVSFGVRAVGGCCGTTPEYISMLSEKCKGKKAGKAEYTKKTVVSSYTHAVSFGDTPVLIGERINPTGKKRFKQALLENDIDYILKEGISQQEKGVHILDVNVGLAGIDEVQMLENAVTQLQAVCDLPLQLDSADADALERSMRIYNGKPLINSVNGKTESMNSIFPLVKKYGGVVVALTLDEDGIPDTADGRLSIARKIIDTAKDFGIEKEDLIFDPLAMTVSTDMHSALTTLECVERIKNELGCNTSLGVSNISFGLPSRDILNSNFFTMALNKGLSAAIMNPYSERMTDAYFAYCALSAKDTSFTKYIEYCSENETEAASPVTLSEDDDLVGAICKGRKEQANKCASLLLQKLDSLSVINDFIIPALDKTGILFENKKIYLPQLLMSAEAASAAFEAVRATVSNTGKTKSTVVLATVKGDIHDIGKNIVKLLLENYGYNVIDLGKDVPSQVIAECAVSNSAAVVGLSALMTTTLSAMEETVKLLLLTAPDCRIVVGGAVVNEEYASSIGAHKYAKDAMETVRFCEGLL